MSRYGSSYDDERYSRPRDRPQYSHGGGHSEDKDSRSPPRKNSRSPPRGGDRYGYDDRYGGSDRYGGDDRYSGSDRYGGDDRYGGNDRYTSSSASYYSTSSSNYSRSSHYSGQGGRGDGDSGGRGGYHGGGGRGGGGRGDGGRGGRGGRISKNPHMGEMQSVMDLLRNESLLDDRACLRIMDPSYEDRFRDDLIVGDGAKRYFLPSMDQWRISDAVGVPIQNIRTNFFVMDPRYLPTTIYLYNVAIYHKDDFQFPVTGTGSGGDENVSLGSNSSRKDLSKEKDSQLNTKIMKAFIDGVESMRRTSRGDRIGLSYDGKSALYASHALDLPFTIKGIYLAEVTVRKAYVVAISQVDAVDVPRTKEQWRDLGIKDRAVLQGLDIALLSFARWQLADEDPRWLLSGTKVFQTNGQTFPLGGMYLGRIGYSSCLRTCLSGLAVVMEVSVSCFLKGGSLLEVMALIGNYRSVDDLVASGSVSSARHPFLTKVLGLLKGTKIKTKHLGQTKKLKAFSFASDDRANVFPLDNGSSGSGSGREVTVAEYYAEKAATDPRYAVHLPQKRLRYPDAVTVDIGGKNRPILVPVELIHLVEGQIRNNTPTEVAASLIKEAAVPPARRMRILTDESMRQGLFQAIQKDENVAAFGLHHVSTTPMKVDAVILPPPKLQYGNNRVIQPELKGAWNLAGNVQFAYPAPVDVRDPRLPYGLVTTYLRTAPLRIDDAVERFRQSLEHEAEILGTPLRLVGRAEVVSGDDHSLQCLMQYFHVQEVRIVVVLLYTDVYAFVKLAADRMRLPTQCVKWSNVERPPNRYHTSLLIKMNYKMGGVNHTLASRASPFGNTTGKRLEEEPVFQEPPKSISWLFDEPCMVMGVDVNHPEVGQSDCSVAAVVASMDGKLGQYAAYVTTCASREEPVQNLQEATSALLDAFSRRNHGATPRKIIVYRDGVSDNQFETVLEREVTAYKEALMLRGFGPDDVQIAVIMCQKRHQTRLMYQADAHVDGNSDCINPCVGLCVDGRSYYGQQQQQQQQQQHGSSKHTVESDRGCINTPGLNEFYLNSHAAILGTAKPCKYVLIYDEIGLKLSEIELFTYWTTHLYCRCTRSVSYATPAYYAHWAARRGKALLSAGASVKELSELSQGWLQEGLPSMYFV